MVEEKQLISLLFEISLNTDNKKQEQALFNLHPTF